MASRLEGIARAAIGGDSIMDGRESMKTVDIIAKYPDGICITGIAQNTFGGRTYPVFTFAEEPSRYFCGGKRLSEWTSEIIEKYDGNLVELNDDLKKEYLKIKLVRTKTKNGHDFTNVIFLGVVPAPNVEADEDYYNEDYKEC